MKDLMRAAIVTTLLAVATAAEAQSATSVTALKQWVAAVTAHQPGRPDAAARMVAGLTYQQRSLLNPAMEVFLSALRGEGVETGSDTQDRILELLGSVRTDPGIGPFIRRAAVLHTDAAILANRFPAPPDDAPPASARDRSRRPPPPLLFNDRYTMHRDGLVIGEMPAEWNWGFARSLLGLLPADDDAFVAEWFHAVNAYLMFVGNLADLKPQLQDAAAALPDDPRALFDRACYAETLGLPYNQVLREGGPNSSVDLPSEDHTNAEAERLFRRTLAADATYAEARVRLARLLDHDGRHDEAAAEVERALAAAADPTVMFYGRLVAGRTSLARNRGADALAHYTAATALFPDAQSALLGASEAAVMTADVGAAVSFVQRLSPRSKQSQADPWRVYSFCAGRDVNDLMAALWAHVGKPQ